MLLRRGERGVLAIEKLELWIGGQGSGNSNKDLTSLEQSYTGSKVI